MKAKKEGNAETRKTVWLESPNPDLLVRVSQYESKDRGPYLVGIAYTRESVTQILPEIKRTRMIRNGYSVELCRKIIVNRVTDDEGTRQFLLGMKLESITDDNYVSYTSPEASERLFAIQNRCLPARPLPGERTVTDLGNGMVRIELQPRATNETLSVLLQGDFAPGLNLEATARHGVSASVRVRELKEDGTPKRAKKKTKTS